MVRSKTKVTEEIINALAKIGHLKVTSRTSSFFFKGRNIPIPDIGKELNVSTILEGSVRLAKSEMRITAQLVDAADDFHFWSETWDRELQNIFEGSQLLDISEYIANNKLYNIDKEDDIYYHEPCHSPLKQQGYDKTFSAVSRMISSS